MSIILGVSLLMLSFKEWVVVSSFLVNRTAIAKRFCVERNNASSCCKGSCFLKSSLKDINEEEQHTVILERERTQQYVPSDLLAMIFVRVRDEASPRFLYSALQTQWYIREFSKPPWV